MNAFQKLCFILVTMTIILIGCESEENISGTDSDGTEDIDVVAEVEEDVPDITLSSYAEEIGFSLTTPTKSEMDVQTSFHIQGKLEKINDLTGDLIWVVITSDEEPLMGIDSKEFNYYISLEHGDFSKELNVHNGAGNYQVSIRVPSNNPEEEGSFYEVASFQVNNQDQEVQREVEYTRYSVEQGLTLASPVAGFSESAASVYVEGTVPEPYAGDMVLVQVERENEQRQILLPVSENSFSGEVPLYFGEGLHHIRVQLFNEEDSLYYDSAMFYTDNQTSVAFAEMETYQTYMDHGMTLYEPTWKTESNWEHVEYPVAGEIDSSLPGAEKITHVIVTMNYLDEGLESGYLIPVENFQFEGTAYFRFGPGEYEVMINVPSMDQHDQSMFYFQSVAKLVHHIDGINDQRDLLPSRGIESDHPSIVQKAQEVTAGLTSDREKALAVYEFVAGHVAYDVEKAENDMFNIGDSAVTTLESGIGICQDYAFLATALLRAIGMEAHYVEGDAGERHAWVEVNVDGEWMEMDPTWGAGYVQNGEFHFHYNEDYFDPDPTFFAETHTREGIMY